MDRRIPRVALICHEQDALTAQGIAACLAGSFELAGVVHLRERPVALWRRIRRELRRSGLLGFLDVIAFRLFHRLFLARAEAAWVAGELARLRVRYPARIDAVPVLVAADPNTPAVQCFLRGARPDLVVACCKVLLKPATFGIPPRGTFVLHPGICPEYRNAHGCFWALVNRDLSRVGVTLLRVDEGVDTGPIFLQASYPFDEAHESPLVIQRRVVLENLDAIAARLGDVMRKGPKPLAIEGRASAVWGQPRLSAYWKWKAAVRRTPPRRPKPLMTWH